MPAVHFTQAQLKGRSKSQIQVLARRKLGQVQSLTQLFDRAAEHLGKKWHNKLEGYHLLIEVGGWTPYEQLPIKKKKAARQYQRSKPTPPAIDPVSDEFLSSYAWRKLRMVVLRKFGARCLCCGATPADGVKMHVDHIKPRRKYPELALTESNLQVLCEVCNHGKGNWDETNWSDPVSPEVPAEMHEPLWSKVY